MMPYKDLLRRFVQGSNRIFGDNLVGIYLHGSAAMGCFNPKKSDLDLLVIVKDDISEAQKLDFMNMTVALNAEAPKKGLELSIVKQKFCRPFVYPTPYELHFSIAHLQQFLKSPEDYIKTMHGTDKDLAAHFVITRHCGKVLYGKPVREVFGEVEREAYLDSILTDVEHAREDILENPVYITLNLCRILAFLREDLILSKKSGGEWAAPMLPPPYAAFVREAVRAYESDGKMRIGRETAEEFATYMLQKLHMREESDRDDS